MLPNIQKLQQGGLCQFVFLLGQFFAKRVVSRDKTGREVFPLDHPGRQRELGPADNQIEFGVVIYLVDCVFVMFLPILSHFQTPFAQSKTPEPPRLPLLFASTMQA